jgi:RimJ/RimL family protein N-acetyltransferase
VIGKPSIRSTIAIPFGMGMVRLLRSGAGCGEWPGAASGRTGFVGAARSRLPRDVRAAGRSRAASVLRAQEAAMQVAPVTLEGRHVRLEPMREAHADALVAAGCGRGLFRFFPFVLDTEDAMRAYVKANAAAAASGLVLPFVTIERKSNRVVGATSLLAIDPPNKKLEIGGTWITPDSQRSAVNTEAKLLQLTHCFEVLGCNRVEFKTDERNEKSRNALARIGAQEEGRFRAHYVMPDGHLRTSVWFSVIAPEWPDVKRALAAKLRP